MKNTFLFLLLFSTLFVSSQSNKFGGIYTFGDSPEKRGGTLHLYPKSNGSFLFYLELGRGAPSYGSGAMVGEVQMSTSTTAIFKKVDANLNEACELTFNFSKDSIELLTSEKASACGYGFGVYSDGIYTRTTHEIPEYFIDRIGHKTFFKNLDVKNWSE